jgi:predicted transcriptional regulator
MNPKLSRKRSNNGFRPKIVNYIQVHPGASFKTIKMIFDMNEGTLRYHLKYLEKNGQIKSDPKKRIYYPIGYAKESTLSKTQQKLIFTIRRNPGITQKKLSAKTNLNRITIRKNINLLIQKESVYVRETGKRLHHYYIYPEELKKIKMMKLINKLLLHKIDEETYWDQRNEIKKKE